ncbi:MAG: hypothetical protein IJ372_19790, partial [Rhodococcus sp.]|nr:hypothetical protein [Rhodococcus sp. (in: high G+C Gram-positive bacteria)]
STQEEKERAYLVGLDSERSLEELARLADTAGAVVVGTMLQTKTRPDTATARGTHRTNSGSRRSTRLGRPTSRSPRSSSSTTDRWRSVQCRNGRRPSTLCKRCPTSTPTLRSASAACR